MKYTFLPSTNIKVSKICLGTMTFGNQNSEKEGFDQMDLATDMGVNFIDTAELYPVPATAELYADTEKIIGKWMSKKNNRDQIVLATKIAGPGDYTKHIRKNGFSKNALISAVDGSLKRLKTDYIDLYQLHWPERTSNFFGKRDFDSFANDKWEENFENVLLNLKEIISSGKVRQIGISNENPWAFMKYLELSKHKLPKTITIQNPYSLLNRLFEIGNSEICMREDVGLLAYSPLGFGVLSGKYLNGNMPEDSRLKLFPNLSRFSGENSMKATGMYFNISKKHDLSLSQMALSFVNSRPFVTSNIIGATKLNQLKENIESINIVLSQDVLNDIEEVHKLIPNPAP
ncbi:aldo/keto reductase [Flavobacteriaceae bacterium]|jgi:aryl-alcohol dehydrogenase-like predicted oxidoreductase|nr:aldo/keto reductase [bacterium]MDB4092965.1 aldo/keto reductase [Flavobacteriaceae bacterium]MDB9849458.1 aldo/keto reductase [Flavobacteriaceae bacterium]MDC1337334.1 aldo/keto reductase [Flavobacteriaceae bacterium]MDC1456534.1 aldo/keto reductase [Flavobacteriaceae bacterium]|tara:strand:- start:407 stop:1441 length:1035 start_codon:yes stop_codon:yes gene_type:complete